MTKDTEHPHVELISIAAKAGIGLLPEGGLLTGGYEGLQLFSNQAATQMERSSKRAAATTSLTQSARLSGHKPYAHLKDVLTRLLPRQ